ncbi:YggS family pyridoxal phosphate-dependent enzyme [Oscillospiraceae bacterium HV4-5-C5C]|nr:YggS family pyridoxal phosphate-dependent enzyme [Oscillospiraceae bacterium HV4-5-C5C]
MTEEGTGPLSPADWLRQQPAFAARQARIKENLVQVQQQLDRACEQARRQPEEVKLLAVTKFHPFEDALAAFWAGAHSAGENRVQELLHKQRDCQPYLEQADWQLIGTLQKNKVRQVVGKVSLIQSVDHLELLQALDQAAGRQELTQDILLQFNYSGEVTKHGFETEAAETALSVCRSCKHLRLRGLMTMARPGLSAEEAEAFFRDFTDFYRRLRSDDRLLADPAAFDILSMGMSGDYPAAVRAGSTMIRIGSAIFGPRIQP